MGDKSGIEWTDATWSPVTGCAKVSPGCDNCYAEALTKRFEAKWGDFETVRLHRKRLGEPLRWRKPRRVFVCSMADLFHKKVPDAFLNEVFSTMAMAHRHTFQVLTKRSSRMRDFVEDYCWGDDWPNIWFGVSVEDRKRLVRVRHLQETPAAVRFLSCEPLLEDLGELDLTGIHWVIVGGESGPGARPMHPDWVRRIRDQCQAAGVAFHFKQWGAWRPRGFNGPGDYSAIHTAGMTAMTPDNPFNPFRAGHPGWTPIVRVGKKCAGATLDGREWREFPS